MKRTRIILVLVLALFQVLALQSQNINIPDQCFLDALIRYGADTNGDDLISYAEAEALEKLNTYGGCITDMRGIEAFTNLKHLSCGDNSIKELDLSMLSKLEYLNCVFNDLSVLDLTHNPLLDTLLCGLNKLSSLDLSQCPGLTYVYAADNQLEELDLTQNTKLTRVLCWNNLISELDVSYCTELEELTCSGNLIKNLDLSNNPLLSSLSCGDNQISGLDLSNNSSLEYLTCNNNLLRKLDLSDNPKLQVLRSSNNRLTHLDVSQNPLLGCLDCSSNPMTSLNISINLALDTAGCYWWYADLIIHSMPTLTQVCVWGLPFPPETLRIDATGSPNIYYTTECTAGTALQSLNTPVIFPNPTAHLLNIELLQADRYDLWLTSTSGKRIKYIRFSGSNYQWDISDLSAGIYFLSIRSSSYFAHDKIIKY